MDKNYWNNVCEDYQSEILSVFDNDLHSLVERKIKEVAKEGACREAADIGCGVGRFTLLLSREFEHVIACDFSAVGLKKTRRRCQRRKNVDTFKVDLARDAMPFDPVDFALCVNVLIMPGLDSRLRAWRSVTNQVQRGGVLLLVVPSFESVQMDFYSTIESRLHEGEGSGEAVRNSIEEKALAADLRLGVHQLDGVRTKHYLKDELVQMMESHEFEVREVQKLVYEKGLDNGFSPWDWLVLAHRK